MLIDGHGTMNDSVLVLVGTWSFLFFLDNQCKLFHREDNRPQKCKGPVLTMCLSTTGITAETGHMLYFLG